MSAPTIVVRRGTSGRIGGWKSGTYIEYVIQKPYLLIDSSGTLGYEVAARFHTRAEAERHAKRMYGQFESVDEFRIFVDARNYGVPPVKEIDHYVNAEAKR